MRGRHPTTPHGAPWQPTATPSPNPRPHTTPTHPTGSWWVTADPQPENGGNLNVWEELCGTLQPTTQPTQPPTHPTASQPAIKDTHPAA